MARGADDEKMTVGMEVEIVDYDDFCTLWLKHLPSGMIMPYGKSWKRISTAEKHADMVKEYYEGEGVPVKIIRRMAFRNPKIRLGNQWSNGSLSAWIDLLGGCMEYHPDLGEVLIARRTIDFPPDYFCFELSLEVIHHILNMDFGEETTMGFEIAEELIAVHLFGPEILDEFGWYREGEEMGSLQCR